MAFELPELPYAYNALEPHIDEETMKLHHNKHHQAYVDKLNEALKDYPALQKYPVETLVTNWKKMPKAVQEAIRNQGGGDANHTMFWNIMSENGGGSPVGQLSKQINEDFGSFVKFKEAFNEAGTKQFGSGWVWLIFTDKLKIVSTPNQDSPLTDGNYPIIGNDVWEHAYYIRHQNRRDAYLKAWWNVVNWPEAEKRFTKAKFVSSRKGVRKQYGQ